MFTLTVENIATLLVDGSTIFLLIGVLTQTYIMRKRGRLDDRLFFILIILNIIIAVSDIITYLSDEKTFYGARYFNLGGVSVFYIALVLLCLLWLRYCIIRFGRRRAGIRIPTAVILIPGFVTEIMLLINLFTGLIFSVDGSNVYHRGILFVPMFIVMGLYVFSGFYIIATYKSADGRRNMIPVWIYMLPLVVGIVVPFVIGGISLTSIGVAMSLLFTHAGSESEIVNTVLGKEGII